MMRSDRGVSSVVGVVLLLGITIIGTGVVVGIGSQAFADAERTTTVSQAEHSLTQFDSRAAIVALGESSSQRVDLGSSGDGEFVADGDDGWMRVVHHNATGEERDEEIYNDSMGSVSYHNGDVEIGYQGGGVWERRDGGSVMRSPPEFNYRGATLTLPAIRVTSDARASGQTTAVLSQSDSSQSRQVFPNASASDDDEAWEDVGAPYGDDEKTAYTNPVDSGNVTVTVHSRFYDGWAEFFRTRTTGEVTVDHDRERASVELETVDTVGEFSFNDVNSNDRLTARGQAPGHSLTDFNMTLVSDKGNSFHKQDVTFTMESDEKTLEYSVSTSKGCKQGGGPLSLTVTYENESGTETWAKSDISGSSGPIRLDCGGEDYKLVLNFTSHQNVEYQGSETLTFEHDADEPGTFETGDSTTSDHLATHYVALLGDEFTVSAAPKSQGSQVNERASKGVLDYESGSGGTYITYLHVTENEIEVELE